MPVASFASSFYGVMITVDEQMNYRKTPLETRVITLVGAAHGRIPWNESPSSGGVRWLALLS